VDSRVGLGEMGVILQNCEDFFCVLNYLFEQFVVTPDLRERRIRTDFNFKQAASANGRVSEIYSCLVL
jgi:hypothetical protein